jgi:hypothetical protein
MIITVKNPIDNSDVDVEVNVITKLTTYPSGKQELTVMADGSIPIQEPTEISSSS